jgi:leader peptidase (prepilin peptidase)/N-methyltransferase
MDLLLDCRKRSHADLNLPEQRKRDGRSLKLAFAGLFLAWGLGVPTVTLIHQLSRPPLGNAQMEEMNFVEHTRFRCGEALVTACFFALGCNIGSFLNVVAWRMPLGKSIVYEKSRCPVCSAAIAGKDNIPIFGWLSLGGLCRDCGTKISSRYPIVEAITGSIFLVLYFVELISGGANLPVREINMYRGVLWVIMYAKWDLISLYLYHCFLFSTLLAWTLMAIDGRRIPLRALGFSLIVGLAVPVIDSNLLLVPVWPEPFESPLMPRGAWSGSLFQGLVGGMVGTTVGLLVHFLEPKRLVESPNSKVLFVPGFCLIGIALGWQAVLATTIVYLIVATLMRGLTPSDASSPSSLVAGTLLIAVLIHHLTWRLQWLWPGPWWPGANSTLWCAAVPAMLLWCQSRHCSQKKTEPQT